MRASALRFTMLGALAMAGVSACSRPSTSGSALQFLAGSSANLVTVEPQDLRDDFLFGAIVTDTDTNAAGLVGHSSELALPVQLQVLTSGGAKYLGIYTSQDSQLILAFKVASQRGSSALVDFGNSPSPMAILGALGASTQFDPTGAKVGAVAQTRDSLTVDVAYTCTLADALGSVVNGKFTVRYWWKRRAPNPAFVTRANIDGLGFFTNAPLSNDLSSLRQGQISRLDLDKGPLSFTLTGFPAAYVAAVTDGIKAWERGLGAGTIDVRVGNANVGDPNTIVVKWYDNLPASVPFAGLTYSSADPETGERAASAVLVNGSLVNLFHANYDSIKPAYEAYKNSGSAAVPLSGSASFVAAAEPGDAVPSRLRLGGLTLTRNSRLMDAPAEFMPGLYDETVPFETYMSGYFRAVVMHEVGHVMGLRHNFRASLEADADTGNAVSIMDYADNQQSDKATVIGSYDLAAIRYGYFGETPARSFPYCSDEDQDTDALCNQFDNTADLATYFHTAAQQVLEFASNYDFDAKAGLVGVKSTFKAYYKLANLPSPQQARAAALLKADYAAIQAAVGQTAVQNANLKALRDRSVILLGKPAPAS